MKKSIAVIVLLCLGMASHAQEGLKFGVQGGLAINDYADYTSVILGADFGYMHALSEVVDLGVMVGYIHGFPEKYGTENALIDLPSIQFMPLTASVRIWTSNSFSLGANVGQAIGLNEGNDGGFYYRPQIGFLMGPSTEFNFSYTSIGLDDSNWSTVTLGILYTLQVKRPY